MKRIQIYTGDLFCPNFDEQKIISALEYLSRKHNGIYLEYLCSQYLFKDELKHDKLFVENVAIAIEGMLKAFATQLLNKDFNGETLCLFVKKVRQFAEEFDTKDQNSDSIKKRLHFYSKKINEVFLSQDLLEKNIAKYLKVNEFIDHINLENAKVKEGKTILIRFNACFGITKQINTYLSEILEKQNKELSLKGKEQHFKINDKIDDIIKRAESLCKKRAEKVNGNSDKKLTELLEIIETFSSIKKDFSNHYVSEKREIKPQSTLSKWIVTRKTQNMRRYVSETMGNFL